MSKITFSKAQLLDELDIAENTLRALIEQRAFPHPRKMGAKLFWLVSEVVEWLEGCPRAWGGTDQKSATQLHEQGNGSYREGD